MEDVVEIGGLLSANVMLQIGRDSVDRLTELWGRTPKLVPKISYRLKCSRGQEGVRIRAVSEKAFQRRWPELLDESQPFYGMCIILEHPQKGDRAILDVRSGQLSQLVVKYFDPSGNVDGSSYRYAAAMISELTSVAKRELGLF